MMTNGKHLPMFQWRVV